MRTNAQSSLARVPIHRVRPRQCRRIRVRVASEERITAAAPDDEDSEEDTETSLADCQTVCSAEGDFQVQQSAAEQKLDIYKAGGVAAALAIVGAGLNTAWVAGHQQQALIAVFLLGYAGIIIEEELAFNKAGVALVMAVSLWTVRSLAGDHTVVTEELSNSLAEVSEIVFFLLGAMTIVEVVDAHQGFKIITDVVNTRSKQTLMWIVGTVTFFMSAILDNLTSTIVMVSLLRKLCPDPETRKFLGAVVVIAANAGGVWTPIGDVTTTMLWISGQITTLPTMRDLFLPSLMSAALPMLLISRFADEVKGDFREEDMDTEATAMAPRGRLVFAAGISALLSVPVFKSETGLPPYLGMLAGLGAMWLLTDVIHLNEERRQLQVRPRAPRCPCAPRGSCKCVCVRALALRCVRRAKQRMRVRAARACVCQAVRHGAARLTLHL
jgi:Citrate transporter